MKAFYRYDNELHIIDIDESQYTQVNYFYVIHKGYVDAAAFCWDIKLITYWHDPAIKEYVHREAGGLALLIDEYHRKWVGVSPDTLQNIELL